MLDRNPQTLDCPAKCWMDGNTALRTSKEMGCQWLYKKSSSFMNMISKTIIRPGLANQVLKTVLFVLTVTMNCVYLTMLSILNCDYLGSALKICCHFIYLLDNHFHLNDPVKFKAPIHIL